MAIAPSSELNSRMRAVRDSGMNLETRRLFSPMSDVAACLGLCQLLRYDQAVEPRRWIASRYIVALGKRMSLELPYSTFEKTMFFRFPLKVPGGMDKFQRLFNQENIQVRRGVDQLLHRLMNISDNDFRMSVDLFGSTLSLPIYPALTDQEVAHCVHCAERILAQ
jgi:dTDP-4-amino-4,6-dideoxygalactose transaminase